MPESIQETAGFPPVARSDARVLVLGSLPGQRSIREQQYYAHPQNAFWFIMGEIVGANGNYEDRCACLASAGIALWDVLKSSVRPGSMDADIREETATVNNFGGFFGAHPDIRLVCLNGQKAARLFERHVPDAPRSAVLPSTSPAYAAMPVANKLQIWRSIIGPEL